MNPSVTIVPHYGCVVFFLFFLLQLYKVKAINFATRFEANVPSFGPLFSSRYFSLCIWLQQIGCILPLPILEMYGALLVFVYSTDDHTFRGFSLCILQVKESCHSSHSNSSLMTRQIDFVKGKQVWPINLALLAETIRKGRENVQKKRVQNLVIRQPCDLDKRHKKIELHIDMTGDSKSFLMKSQCVYKYLDTRTV